MGVAVLQAVLLPQLVLYSAWPLCYFYSLNYQLEEKT